nr:transglycosylase [Klebsiella quasipneumoniae]
MSVPEDSDRGFIQYANVPRTIAAVISGKMATLHELDTVYSVQDMWWLIEIMTVDNTNRAIAAESDHGSNGN